jgi:hypothetical protein
VLPGGAYRETGVIANLVVVTGIAGFITTLLDFLLSEKQKARLADWSAGIWNWVDEAKKYLSFVISHSQWCREF